jgi:hypothetical protein
MTLKIDGPIPGGNLPLCDVLRCASQGAYLATLTSPHEPGNGFLAERLLCTEHRDAIEAGEPWRWDDDQGVFLMGEDRNGAGELVVSTYQVETRTFETDTELGHRPLHLTLAVTTATGADAQELHLVLTNSAAADLGKTLVKFAGPQGGSVEQG